MKWNDVTLNQFLKMKEIVQIEDETDRMLSLIELFWGEDVVNLPVAEFNKKAKELDFLQNPVPTNHIVKSATINGRKYKIDALLGHISTAQYVDFTNYAKQENNTDKMLAVFFVPEGHKYNDGYDMLQVIQDMGDLPIDIALSECFFFRRQFSKFIQIFQRSLCKTVNKSKMPKEMKNLLKEQVHLLSNLE
jgi:hypothetical protein